MISASIIESDQAIIARAYAVLGQTEHCRLYSSNEEACLNLLRLGNPHLLLVYNSERPLAVARVVEDEGGISARLFSANMAGDDCVTAEWICAIESTLNLHVTNLVYNTSRVDQSIAREWKRLGSRQNKLLELDCIPRNPISKHTYPIVSHSCEGTAFADCLISAYRKAEDRKLGLYEPLELGAVEDYLSGIVSGSEGQYERSASKAVVDEDTVVGFICVTRRGVEGRFFVAELAVREEHWHKGVGNCLLSAAINEVQCLGGNAICLQHNSTNVPATRLYSRYGFMSFGEAIVYLRRMTEMEV